MDYRLVLVIFQSSSHPFSAFLHSSLSLYRLQVTGISCLWLPWASFQLVAPGDQEARREKSRFLLSLSSCSEAVAACLSLAPALPPLLSSGSSSTVLALIEFHKSISLPCPFISGDVCSLASTTLVYSLNPGAAHL